MTRKLASVFIVLSVAVVLIGSGRAENANKTSGVDNDAGGRSPIFQTEGSAQGLAVATTSSHAAQVNNASFRRASSEELGGMELTLQRYRTAIENLSLPQVHQVWPSLDRRRDAALKEAFEYLRSMSATPRMGLECVSPMVIGESAKVECRESLAYKDAKGKPKVVKPTRVSILLRKQGDNWIVETMK